MVQWFEKSPLSGEVSAGHVLQSMDAVFGITGTSSEAVVMALIRASIPRTYTNPFDPTQRLWLKSYRWDHIGGGVWDVPAKYSTREPLSPDLGWEPENPSTGGGGGGDLPTGGPARLSFDTTGGTQHITQALGNGETVYPTGTLHEFNGAIGVNGDRVDGVDRVIPQLKLTVVKQWRAASLPANYCQLVHDLTGKVNSLTMTWVYKGQVFLFNPNELLYMGARLSDSSPNDILEFAYSFEFSRNAENIVVGTGATAITVSDKKGWQYSWVRYQDHVNTGASTLVKIPDCVVVNDIYESADLRQLGL